MYIYVYMCVVYCRSPCYVCVCVCVCVWSIVGVPAMYCLLETVAVAPDYFAPQFVKELDFIKVLL